LSIRTKGTIAVEDFVDYVFFPPLERGTRVWAGAGYLDHGPKEGPKINIAGNQAGTVERIEG
jgi:hypothetical protein